MIEGIFFYSIGTLVLIIMTLVAWLLVTDAIEADLELDIRGKMYQFYHDLKEDGWI